MATIWELCYDEEGDPNGYGTVQGNRYTFFYPTLREAKENAPSQTDGISDVTIRKKTITISKAGICNFLNNLEG